MSIVTKTGDKGETSLFGGERIPKNHPRIHTYGTVDELNAFIGLTLAEEAVTPTLKQQLIAIQNLLFRVGGDLATPLEKRMKEDRVSAEHVKKIEEWITEIEMSLPPQTQFILPGGSKVSSLLHVCRTVCRRAERWIIALAKQEEVNEQVGILLNRLSDYFFLAARKANVENDGTEQIVHY